MVDRLEAAGDPALRSALLFVRGSERAVTVDELAAYEGVHRNVARSRLERLAAAGLLESAFEPHRRRAGRPSKTYWPAPELASIEFPAHHYEALLGLLADALPPRARRSRLRKVGVAFGSELARAAAIRPAKRAADGLEQACAAVRSLGYQASVESVEPGAAVIATPTCPLRPLVAARPRAAAIDEGMWAGLVAAAIKGVDAADVSCDATDCLCAAAPCRILVRFRQVERSE